MLITIISMFFICSGIIIALLIANDLTRHKQSMKIMNAVWILTGLWASYAALWAYRKFGRENRKMNMQMQMGMNMPMKRPHWQSVTLSTLHCGAGCTLADIIGEWFTYYFPIRMGGSMLAGNWTFDFVLALIIGVYFQFYAIREMEKISVLAALKRALKADFFSLLSWQIGMYGWMAIVHFVLFKEYLLGKDTWTFWFMMQIAMLAGFICAYPVNALLIKFGVKKEM